MSQKADVREQLRSIFLECRLKCEMAIADYRYLRDRIPSEQRWKIQRECGLWDSLGALVAPEICAPDIILEHVLSGLDEYRAAIDEFTEDELAAFLLGVGASWIPLRYWGMDVLYRNLNGIERSLAHYEQLEAMVEHNDLWKIEKSASSFSPMPDLLSWGTCLPSQTLSKARDLIAGSIAVLERRPF